MPISSSKGLEFDTVLILDSTFMLDRNLASADTPSEEVRKLYVGLTRAKSHLVITYHRENSLSRALQAQQKTS